MRGTFNYAGVQNQDLVCPRQALHQASSLSSPPKETLLKIALFISSPEEYAFLEGGLQWWGLPFCSSQQLVAEVSRDVSDHFGIGGS